MTTKCLLSGGVMVVYLPERVIFNSLVKVILCFLVVLDGNVVKKFDFVEGLFDVVVAVVTVVVVFDAAVVGVFVVAANLVEDGLSVVQYPHVLAQFCLMCLIQFPSNQQKCMNS